MSWLEDLKEGDAVFIAVSDLTLSHVQRVTAKFIIVDGLRYGRSTGIHCGYKELVQVTRETMRRFRAERLNDACVGLVSEIDFAVDLEWSIEAARYLADAAASVGIDPADVRMATKRLALAEKAATDA